MPTAYLACHLHVDWRRQVWPRVGKAQGTLRVTAEDAECCLCWPESWDSKFNLSVTMTPQGILLPLCQSGTCTLREAVVLSSVLK